jgi:hypothetical protein
VDLGPPLDSSTIH